MKLILFIFVTICLSNCIGQPEETNRPNDNKNFEAFSVKNVISNSNPNYGPDEARYHNEITVHNVKKTTKLVYLIDKASGEAKFDRVDSTFLEYDKTGAKISYMNIGNRCFKYTYIYDGQNRISEEISSDCKGEIGSQTKTTYTDSTIIITSGDAKQNKIIYTLDSCGNKLKREDYNGGNAVNTFWIKRYDSNKNVVDFKFFIYDSLEFYQTYKYDDDDVLLSSTVVKFPDELTNIYDFNGELMVLYSDARVKTFAYDDMNNTITETRTYDSKDSMTINYLYDDFGNILEVNATTNNSKETWSTYVYLYDRYGNITEQKSFWKGQLSYLTKCYYEYYK